jgi:hypothetical protein
VKINYIKNAFVLFLALLVFLTGYTQRYIWSPDSLSLSNPNYGMDRYHDILRYHDPIMYLAIPIIRPIVNRTLNLVDGEGKNGYWLEYHFGYRFAIYNGKYYSLPFLQHIRFTLDANLSGRLTRDNSNPLLPFNNKFGVGLDYLFSRLNTLTKEKANLVWITLQLHHYSNGQADSFFIDNPIRRNNYMSGDFSTNYGKFMLNFGRSSRDKSILITSIGYQQDLDLGGPLERSKEMEQYYGNSRLLFSLHWAQKPQLRTVNYSNFSNPQREKISIERRRQFGFRIEMEYIFGNMDSFPQTRKYRVGWHNYLTYAPSVTNEVGFMAHTYVGRDYLNIRFDDIVFVGELGLYLKFGTR